MSTFTEYQKLSQNMFQVGLFTAILTESDLAARMQMKKVAGNNLDFDRESVNPVADFTGNEATLTSTDPEFTTITEALRTLYVQSDLNLKTQALAIGTDPRVALHSRMAKEYARKLEWAIVNGDNNRNGNEFNGLIRTAETNTRMRAMDDGALDGPGAAETELTIARLRVVIDDVKPGDPDFLGMNKTMRRKLTSLAYAAGGGITLPDITQFGRKVRTFDDLPISISEWCSDSETYNDSSTWASSTATTIVAAKTGEAQEGFTLLHGGQFWDAQLQDLGIRKDADKRVYRMISYPGSALYSVFSIGALGGIDSAA